MEGRGGLTIVFVEHPLAGKAHGSAKHAKRKLTLGLISYQHSPYKRSAQI